MKIRSHILLRFKDLKKSKGLLEYKKNDDGHFEYSFNTKIVLVVNALEHEHIQQQISKGTL